MARPKTTRKTKICPLCEKKKSRKFFYSTSAYCKKCQRKTVMDNQKANSDYYNEYRTEYGKRNPEKKYAWKQAFIKNWETEHGMKYKDYVLQQHHDRLATDPTYREKIRKQRKQYRKKNKKKYDQYRAEYYIQNRDLLLAKAKLRRCEKGMAIATNSKIKKDYAKRIKTVRKQIQELTKKK